jgi:hypothetical protein
VVGGFHGYFLSFFVVRRCCFVVRRSLKALPSTLKFYSYLAVVKRWLSWDPAEVRA